jgi:TolB-like protein
MVSAAGVQPIPVAVVDFKAIGTPQDFADAVAENLRNALVQHQPFTVIERAQIQQAIREQSFSLTSLVDSNEAVSLGKLVGAKVIVVGSVTKLGDTYTINARFIDVTTGRVTDAKSLKTDNANYLADVVDDLASALGGKTTPVNAPPTSFRNSGARMAPTGKSKLLAAVMSAVIPGSGQVYNGNTGSSSSSGADARTGSTNSPPPSSPSPTPTPSISPTPTITPTPISTTICGSPWTGYPPVPTPACPTPPPPAPVTFFTTSFTVRADAVVDGGGHVCLAGHGHYHRSRNHSNTTGQREYFSR